MFARGVWLSELQTRAHQLIEHQCPYQLTELMTRSNPSAPPQHAREAWCCPSESCGLPQAPRAAFSSQEAWEADWQSPVMYHIPKREKGYCASWWLAVWRKNHPILHTSLHQSFLPVWPHLRLSQGKGRRFMCLCQHPLHSWEAAHNRAWKKN